MRVRLRITCLLVALASIAPLAAYAQTASGKGLVPPFDARYGGTTAYFAESFLITNITSNPINVTLNIYSQTGTLQTGEVIVVSGTGAGVSNFALNSGGSTAVFTLAANSTTHLSYNNTSVDCGYATIAWTQPNSKETYGLLADVKENYLNNGTFVIRTIAVNNNMPF